jgi:hypothetical protein
MKLFEVFENEEGRRKWKGMRVGWTNKRDGKELQKEERCMNTKRRTKTTKEMSLFKITKHTNARKCHGQLKGYCRILNKCVL